MKVNFYDEVDDVELKFAVIMTRYKNKWVFCKHRERETYEMPGGHREAGETINEAAVRELQEETGAIDFKIRPVSVYSATGKTRLNQSGAESFGMLFFAEVQSFKDTLENEIEKIEFFDKIPEKLTYPEIQPYLYDKVMESINF
ncbi:MAG TPA: DNA mismatch repair protein MutT [Clostridiales bacterium]|nr:DNA mismatch repair protein MutT [Clostridiales bacterium]